MVKGKQAFSSLEPRKFRDWIIIIILLLYRDCVRTIRKLLEITFKLGESSRTIDCDNREGSERIVWGKKIK